jgi:hypothetical protein
MNRTLPPSGHRCDPNSHIQRPFFMGQARPRSSAWIWPPIGGAVPKPYDDGKVHAFVGNDVHAGARRPFFPNGTAGAALFDQATCAASEVLAVNAAMIGSYWLRLTGGVRS